MSPGQVQLADDSIWTVYYQVDQVQAAGRYEAIWNGTNITGAGVASGIYLYRITSGSGYTETKRMTLRSRQVQ